MNYISYMLTPYGAIDYGLPESGTISESPRQGLVSKTLSKINNFIGDHISQSAAVQNEKLADDAKKIWNSGFGTIATSTPVGRVLTGVELADGITAGNTNSAIYAVDRLTNNYNNSNTLGVSNIGKKEDIKDKLKSGLISASYMLPKKYSNFAVPVSKLISRLNFKAGGKIIKGLGGFKSELDWSPESWFGTYRYGVNRTGKQWTDEDEKELASHLLEYNDIERLAKQNKTWLKNDDGSDWDGSEYNNDPRAWVMLLSKAFKGKFDPKVWYSGQGDYPANHTQALEIAERYREGDTDYALHLDNESTYLTEDFVSGGNTKWLSDSQHYGGVFAHDVAGDGIKRRSTAYRGSPYAEDNGHIYNVVLPHKNSSDLLLESPRPGTFDDWTHMPYNLETFLRTDIVYQDETRAGLKNYGKDKIKTDDIVDAALSKGYRTVYMNNVWDGTNIKSEDGKRVPEVINEAVTKQAKSVLGNSGNFDLSDPRIYARNQLSNPSYMSAKHGGLLSYLNYINN